MFTPARLCRAHPIIFSCLTIISLFLIWCSRSLLYDALTLAALPLIWSHNSDEFLITPKDGFDITFEYYDRHQDSAAPYENLVPPILHHIALGEGAAAHAKWTDVRQTCLDMHKGWDAFLWTDATADSFVAEHFPDLVGMWRSYRYPIQKIDSLRYMVLYHYGGKHRSGIGMGRVVSLT